MGRLDDRKGAESVRTFRNVLNEASKTRDKLTRSPLSPRFQDSVEVNLY